MKTVKEVSGITGVSIRTLRYYDETGLLKPTELTEAGYRLYDNKALEKLQEIVNHTLACMSEENVEERVHKFGSLEKYKEYLTSVNRGQHASSRVILPVFCVILRRRTSSTPPSSALKTGRIPTAEVEESEQFELACLQGT